MARTKIASNASFSGAQKGLSFVLDRVYAYSGLVQVASTDTEQLSFQSGKQVIVGSISCYGSVDDSNPGLGSITAFTISFNGVKLFKIKTDTENEDMPSVQTVPLIIPPLTKVIVNADNNNADAGLRTAVSIAGRVYA